MDACFNIGWTGLLKLHAFKNYVLGVWGNSSEDEEGVAIGASLGRTTKDFH